MSGCQLQGKTAWVTGSSRGLGRVIAEELAAAGARVVINCLSRVEAAGTVAAGIVESGGEAMVVAGDATDAADVDRMAGEIEDHWGGVDILVVNATPEQAQREIADYPWEEYQAMLDAFVKSPYLLARRLLPGMRARDWGRIINITSEVYHASMPGFSAYVAAKGGQIGWCRSMAVELAPHGITVNTVAPGWIPVERHGDVPQADKDAYLATIPAGRWGTPADVAGAVRYFASEQAGFVSGQTLLVNGGRTPW